MAISDVLTALRMDHCTGIRMDHLRFDIDTHQDAMHPKHQCQKNQSYPTFMNFSVRTI